MVCPEKITSKFYFSHTLLEKKVDENAFSKLKKKYLCKS